MKANNEFTDYNSLEVSRFGEPAAHTRGEKADCNHGAYDAETKHIDYVASGEHSGAVYVGDGIPPSGNYGYDCYYIGDVFNA